MGGFLLLHGRRLLEHPARVAMAVVGVAAGTALIVAMLGIYTSITASVAHVAEVAGRADLELTPVTDVGFDTPVLETAASMPGVEATAPLVRSWIAVDGEVVLLVGADRRAAHFASGLHDALGSAHGDPPGTGAGIILTRTIADRIGARAGTTVAVYTNVGGARSTTVLGVLSEGGASSVNGGRVAFSTLPHAQALTGRPMFDTVLVDLDRTVDVAQVEAQLRATLGPTVLVEDRATRNARIAAPAVTYLSQVGPVSAMALVVGGFLVFNTMNMAAMERRRELATLRTLGASRRRLVTGLLGEAALIGAGGSVLGAAAGTLLARQVVDGLPRAMEQAIGTEVSYSLPPLALALAALVGVGASVTAAAIPTLRVTRSHPLEALRPTGTLAAGGEPTAVSARPLAVGLVLVLTGLVVLTTVRGDRATIGILVLTLGGVMASYALAGPTAALAGRIARLGGGLGHLAASGIERSPHRVWGTSMAVALSVAMIVAVASGARNQLDLDARHLAELRSTDLLVAARPLDQLSVDVYLPEDLPAVLERIDGVEDTWGLTTQQGVLDNRSFLLYGAEAHDGSSSFPALELARPGARAATLAGDAIVVTHQFARAFGLAEGDLATIPGARGTLRLPVADVVETLSVSDNGMVVVADRHLREVFGTRGVSSIDLALEDGADPATIRRHLDAVAASATHPMVVSTGDEAYRAIIGGIVAVTRLLYAVLAVTAGVAAIAVLNTLVASVLDRWRELGVLRAVGTTPGQLARIITLEAAGIGALGALGGLVMGTFVHWAGIRYIGDASPLPAEYAFVPEVLAVAAIAGIGATVLGALVPIRRATRLDVLEAIAWE